MLAFTLLAKYAANARPAFDNKGNCLLYSMRYVSVELASGALATKRNARLPLGHCVLFAILLRAVFSFLIASSLVVGVLKSASFYAMDFGCMSCVNIDLSLWTQNLLYVFDCLVIYQKID